MPQRRSPVLAGVALACTVFNPAAGADQPLHALETAGVPEAYLQAADEPDSAALLPPPPAEGSAALGLDQDVNRRDLSLRGSPRWRLAGMDANLSFPWAAGVFACALDAPISQIETPRLYRMLRRVMADAQAAARPAKEKYRRRRPFLLNGEQTCTPGAEEALAAEGSYPSAHAAVGWAWALVLSELAPERSGAILARGLAFGDSRLVCNVHWDSDVIEARLVADATVAKLRANADFVADVAAADEELAAVRAKKLAPQRDCKFEAEALAGRPPQAP